MSYSQFGEDEIVAKTKRNRKLRTREEIESEYEALVGLKTPMLPWLDRTFEHAALIQCLTWILWGTGVKPSKWLKGE